MGFYSRLLLHGYVKERDLARSGSTAEFEQIAYGVRPMVVTLLRLYEATKKEEYLALAGLSASWLTGNNAATATMYDETTGRGYDGIRDSNSVNLNSGAESTIEALHSLLEIERYPEARRFLHYRKTSSDSLSAAFRGSDNRRIVIVRLTPDEGSLSIIESAGE